MIKASLQNKLAAFSCLIVILLCFSACGNHSFFAETEDFSGKTWHVDNKPTFSFEVNDTISKFNFHIVLRNNEEYEYSNLFLFLKTDFPNNKYSIDTLECILARPNGEWLGKGFGAVKTNKIIYAQAKRFPISGTYTITLEHAMRQEKITGILSAGITIEPLIAN
ncbi:MAG: gliding motility lipoprotein GldH [Luteibaculaceae bacterium]